MRVSDDIAVVGTAYKLPQDVEDDAAFWEVLRGAKNLCGEWPKDRMNAGAHPDPRNGQFHSSRGHFIRQDPAAFDAPLFSLTAKEAASMDPVQRWTLEVCYRAFENAGIPSEGLAGSRTAVLSATFTEDYIRMTAMDPENVERTAATGCLASVIPNRVSYFFGLQGPSMHIDTACSSGLSAFDVACKLLQSGDAEAALVTAANLILEPGMYQMFRSLQMLAPDSTCKAFDHKANGFGRGEGVLAFVLKPLSAALQDGDMIRAVVRGVASNQDGRTPALSQPSAEAHEALIRHVYAQAGLGLLNTGYVEAHGTGTAVGDPIEMKGIGNAFRKGRSAEAPLYVGSVKSNIGHLEGASGLAGILKAILILERGIIPPNALFEKLNPAIDADYLRVKVPQCCVAWPSPGLRRVSVNGFGFGGSNTHIVLDDAFHYLEERTLVGHHCTAAVPLAIPARELEVSVTNGVPRSNGNTHVDGIFDQLQTAHTNGNTYHAHTADTTSRSQLLVFSAFDEKAVKRTIQGYSAWYQANNLSSNVEKLNALAYTLTARRNHMRWRSFAIGGTSSNQISPVIPNRITPNPGLAWIFTGQGAQYVNMGWELIKAYPVFEETIKRVDGVYKSLGCGWSVFDQLQRDDNINKPEYSQPLSTAIQLALIELLRSFGIVPKAVVGHSSGEIAAAYAIGAVSLASACKVSYYRGLIAGKLRDINASSPGSMISVNLAPDQVCTFLSKIGPRAASVGVACINSPFNVTLSGPESGIDAVKAQANEESIFAQTIKTGVAYHSPAMRHGADEYLALMGGLVPAERRHVPMFSTVTGKMISPEDLTKSQYWVDNMTSPVKYATAVQLMASESMNLGLNDFIEIGPHPALRRYVQDTLGKNKVQYLSALYRGYSATDKILELAGTLFCHGYNFSLSAVNTRQENETLPFLVDCPSYPFDHSHKFWAESRIARDYRLRVPTKGGSLGQRVSDWNPFLPRWRNFLSVETHPWIAHHVVGDAVLYPAAGMLIMAIEAAQEMISDDSKIAGYLVKEAQFMSPVMVPEYWDDRVETILSLRPIGNTQGMTSLPAWSDISMFTYSKQNHSWTEVFRACIQVQYASDVQQLQRRMTDDFVRTQYNEASEACTLPIDPRLLYGDAAEYGLQYGELFQQCQDIFWDKAGARAIASVPSSSSAKFETPSLVHPAVLDTAFHVLRVSAGQQNAANVPVRLEDAWFAPNGWKAPATSSVRWQATSKGRGKATRGEKGSVSALADDGTVLATIATLVTAAVTKDDSESLIEVGQAGQKRLLHDIEWKPQLSMLSPRQLSLACKADIFPRDGRIMLEEHRKRTAVLNAVAVRHVQNIPEQQRANLNSTLRHHMDWMEHHVRSLPSSEREAAENLSDKEFDAQLDSFATTFPSWTLYPHVARSLPAIVAGEVDPLQVIFESDHAKTFYASLFHTVCGDGRLSSFLDLAAHETPSLRILEVGAGTGGMTVHILNALKERETRTRTISFIEYTYTDISPVFFESAKARWDAEGLGGRMTFKTLDMEHSISDQGFVENSYDLIVAGSCVHATGSLSNTLQNLRRILKPGGKLVLLEVTDPTDIATCFFATLASGWWLSQEAWRVNNKSPLASEESWDRVLMENGFSGNDLVLRDTQEAEAHIVSVIVSTAIAETEKNPGTYSKRVFVVDPQQLSQKELASVLSSDTDIILPFDRISEAVINGDDTVISLAEVGNPLLNSISEANFVQLQALIKQSHSLVWVTAPEKGADNTQLPLYSIAQGFLRTVRAEMSDNCIVLLAIEDICNAETQARFIDTVTKTAFGSCQATEVEYFIRSGQICTARAVENVSANAMFRSIHSPRLQEISWKDGPAVKLALGIPGNLDSLRFEQDEMHNQDLGTHEIEIEARSWGLSRWEVLAALGRLDDHDPDGLGTDCAGVVTRVGPGCDSQGPKPGDSVVMLARGCMRKYPRAHERCVLSMSSDSHNLSFETMTSALGPITTAYHALLNIAQVEQGDKILIHRASSATGQMAVQIAKINGAEVFATTYTSSVKGEEEERQFLINNLGVAPDHIFSSSNQSTSFALGVKRATQGYGVDIVINSLSGDQMHASWEVLAPCGRFLDIRVGKSNEPLPIAVSSRANMAFAAVDVLGLRPQVTARLLENTIRLLNEGVITPPTPVQLIPATTIKEAFGKLHKGEGMGRVVLTPRPDDVLPQLVLDKVGQRPLKFNGNASYLIPGGLGGLGRSILLWMAAHGAKHLIVPSRSGPSTSSAVELISTLSSSGVQIITPKCNVANEAELADLLRQVQETMPTIRGVINCAMVLTNAVFTNMSFQQWSSAIQAKVHASYNLHRLLPNPNEFDFFIHLASLAGVNGQMASANYAAGCTFQDALARCYPGVTTLDVGWMADVGLIAETAAFQRQLMDWGNMQRVEERELLGVLGMVCASEKGEKETLKQQLLLGLRTPADYTAKGKEPPPGLLGRPFLSTYSHPISLYEEQGTKAVSAQAAPVAVDYGTRFRSAVDDKSRAQVVTSALAEKLARAMMMSADDVDPARPLSAYGIDSLMGMELRNWIGREFGVKLGMWEIMSGGKVIKSIAEGVVQKSRVSKN